MRIDVLIKVKSTPVNICMNSKITALPGGSPHGNLEMRLFLCGDVMTGRGIDQIMPRHCDPEIHEPYMRSALGYVGLAEQRSGPIPRAVPPDYIWGDALADIEGRKPDLRIVNLETSVTDRGSPEPKGINYRMHPANVACLAAARVDCCVLANNHIGDWGTVGMTDTLDSLHKAEIAIAGAGFDDAAARRPAILDDGRDGRLLVFAYAFPSSGTPLAWAAGRHHPGVNLLNAPDGDSAVRVAGDIAAWRRPGDTVLLSLHWGANWGYGIAEAHRTFAHRVIEEADVDILHGHSSHHPIAIEIHRGRPVLYGCGDFINDYEGIGGNEEYRPDLVLGYVLDYDKLDGLQALEALPYRLRKFRLERPPAADVAWLATRLDRECGRFGHRVETTASGSLALLR